jgi:hypothetical protein
MLNNFFSGKKAATPRGSGFGVALRVPGSCGQKTGSL